VSEREIPRDEWYSFSDRFSRTHRGWLVTVSVDRADPRTRSPQLAAESRPYVVRNVPLGTLAAVPNPHGTSFVLQTSDRGRTRILVEQPRRLRLQTTDEGAEAALCIDADNGRTMRIAFRVVARPETTNGLTDAELDPGF